MTVCTVICQSMQPKWIWNATHPYSSQTMLKLVLFIYVSPMLTLIFLVMLQIPFSGNPLCCNAMLSWMRRGNSASMLNTICDNGNIWLTGSHSVKCVGPPALNGVKITQLVLSYLKVGVISCTINKSKSTYPRDSLRRKCELIILILWKKCIALTWKRVSFN